MSNGQALEELRTDGYVILRGVLPDPVLEEARKALRPLLERQAWGKGRVFRQSDPARSQHSCQDPRRRPSCRPPGGPGAPPGHAHPASGFDCERNRDPPGRDGSVSSSRRCGVSDRSSPPASDRERYVGPDRVHRREGATRLVPRSQDATELDKDPPIVTAEMEPGSVLVWDWRTLPRRGCQLRPTAAPRIERELQLRLASPAREPISRNPEGGRHEPF